MKKEKERFWDFGKEQIADLLVADKFGGRESGSQRVKNGGFVVVAAAAAVVVVVFFLCFWLLAFKVHPKRCFKDGGVRWTFDFSLLNDRFGSA